MRTAVVYWSGTGNTEAMAQEVEQGMKEAGAETEVFEASAFSGDKMGEYDAVAFGCPSMGEMKNWKIQSLLLCLKNAKAVYPAKRSGFSDLMDGATENGCGIGKLPAEKTALIWSRMV